MAILAQLRLDHPQSRLQLQTGQARLAYNLPQGPLTFVCPPPKAGYLRISLGKVAGNLPDQRHCAVPCNQALDVLIVGLVQGAGYGLRQRRILKEGLAG